MTYYCQIYNNNPQTNSPDDWQGPFDSVSPQAAASLWIKQEWDCRHNETIVVTVRDDEDQEYVIRYQAKVMLTLEDSSGPSPVS